MRKTLVIARREYLAAVRTKSFLIGIILMPVLMSGSFAAQYLLKDQVDVRPRYFAILDRTPGAELYPVLAQAAELRNKLRAEPASGVPAQAAYHLEQVPVPAAGSLPELRLRLSERTRDGELTGFLEIGPEVMSPPSFAAVLKAGLARLTDGNDMPADKLAELEPHALRYQTNHPSYLDFPKWAEASLSAAVQLKRALKAGVAPTTVTNIIQPVPLFTKGLTTRDPVTGAIREGRDENPIVAMLLPGGLLVLMFLVVLLGATPLMQGVIEEKMQRIAEVLLGSVRPFQLMMGKLIGMAGVSLTLACVYLGGAYAVAWHYGYAEYLSADVIAWFLVYQVLAVFMFGSIYAAVGAACTDMKEAQAMLTPVTLVIMVPLFVWINVVREPTSAFATFASLFPPATPMLMIARLAVPPGIPWWQPALGVVLVVLTTVICVYAAGRIFRVGLLLQGKGANLAELLRWVIRG
jgi:ABC-2 type transport system permease protein